jgi:hypothetical protein
MDKDFNPNRIYYSFIRISNKKLNNIPVYSPPAAPEKKVLAQKSSSQYTALVVLFADCYIFAREKRMKIVCFLGSPWTKRNTSILARHFCDAAKESAR